MPPQPYTQHPAQPYSGQYPQQGPHGYGAPPVNVVVNQQTSVKTNSGWWAALLLMLFGTPVGCIAIPLALVLMCVAMRFAPIIIAACVCVFLSKSELPSQTKTFSILGVLGAGVLLNVVLLTMEVSSWSHSAPAPTSPPALSPASPTAVP